MLIFNNRAFTLAELVVIFAIFLIVTTVGMVSFTQYGNLQQIDSTLLEITSILNKARVNAVAQNLVSPCTSSLLRYSVRFVMPRTYDLYAYCNGSNFRINRMRLPSSLSFDPTSTSEIDFKVSTGFSSGGVVRVRLGSTTSKNILVDGSGNISVQ